MEMTIIKSDSTARRLLLIIWFLFFISNLSFILYLYFDKWIEKDNFHEALKQLNAIYAPYIGAISMFYWGITGKRKKNEVNKVGIGFTLALLCSLLWNGVILFFILPLIFQTGTIEDSIENIQQIGGLFSWLVAGAIGYYFANPSL
jgi:hypothetical protein